VAESLWCVRCARAIIPETVYRDASQNYPYHGSCRGRVLDLEGSDARLLLATVHLHALDRALAEARYHAEELQEHDMNALGLKLVACQKAAARWRRRHGLD
jgi:hypothetical protein